MNVGLLSTTNTNIGDDFIREGLLFVLRKSLPPNIDLNVSTVNKHDPLSPYPSWHPIRMRESIPLLPRGRGFLQRRLTSLGRRVGHTTFDKCDLIIQCGTPILWNGCSKSEWAEPVWQRIFARLRGRIPILNLAGGSCYPLNDLPERLDPMSDDGAFVRLMWNSASVTTVRDKLAAQLFKSVGHTPEIIPCSAILAGRSVGAMPSDHSGPVLLNFMKKGGHWDFGDPSCSERWAQTLTETYLRIRKKYPIAFLCHNDEENELAQSLTQGDPVFHPRSVEEYFEAVSHARAAICNRMHASVALAGIGIPSIAVCNDSRLFMVKTLGLPTMDTSDANAEKLIEEIDGLIGASNPISAKLLSLKNKTLIRYQEVVSQWVMSIATEVG